MAEAISLKPPIRYDVETPYIKFWTEDSVLCAAYANNIHVNLDIAKHIVEHRINYSKFTSHLCFVDMRGIRSVTKEARQYLSVEGSAYVIAGALLIDSVLNRTIGNIFLTVNKPAVPVRLFTSKEEAFKWLKLQLQTYRQ